MSVTVARRRATPVLAVSAALSLVCAVVFGGLVGVSSASPAPAKLWTVGQNCGDSSKLSNGECNGAGETFIPRGIAADPVSGHLYVADQSNSRVDEFTAWGVFVKAWGWGVRDGSPELQMCGPGASPPSATCRRGLEGGGPGEFQRGVEGVAVDSNGDLYVVDQKNHRVQKFDPEGGFVLMFGGGVDQGPYHPGDLCTAAYVAEGDTCSAGTTGTANGQFGAWPAGSFVAVGPADQVYVGDKNRIQRFSTGGVYVSQLPLPEPGEVASLAVDRSTGDLYFAYPPPSLPVETPKQPNVFRLDPTTGAVLDTLEVKRPSAIATDPAGDVYVFGEGQRGESSNDPGVGAGIFEFGSDGKLVGVVAQNQSDNVADEFDGSTGIATNTVTHAGGVDLYLSNANEQNSFVRAYGPPPDKWSPPPVAPSIAETYALSVGSDDAKVGALINPHFWSDTTYYVEYGTAPCSEGGCVSESTSSPGSALGVGTVDQAAATAGVFLTGLAPGSTYHYRFVAVSGGGGPTVGPERAFTTPALPVDDTACENQALRTGASAALPDCRAYELVSPLEKAGGDILATGAQRLDQSAVSGDAFTYSSYRAFGEPQSAPFTSQYLARRDPESGWRSVSISAPQEGENVLTNEYLQLQDLDKVFSSDLQTAWNLTLTEPVLGEGAVAGHPSIYRRDNTTGAYRACITSAPPEGERENDGPDLEGVTADQQHAIFRVENRLTADASEAIGAAGWPVFQVYECSFSEGSPAQLRLVSVLPDGSASGPEKTENTAGTQAGAYGASLEAGINLTGAISSDGSRVFWTAVAYPNGLLTGGAPGQLYVRVNATEPPSPINGGKCTKAARACTYSISGAVDGEPARFWAASPDGSRALVGVESGAQAGLYIYDVDRAIAGNPAVTQIVGGGSAGVLGASEDLSRVYFLAEQQIGGKGTAGKPNLYLYQAGEIPTYTYIATLSTRDGLIAANAPTPVQGAPRLHTARVTPDGADLVFTSDEPVLAQAVAGYDNTDQTSGLPDAEIYRYDAGSGALACVSCNPTGARPTGRETGSVNNREPGFWVAARLSAWATSLYAPRVISDDGARVFFDSFEALVPADTNGRTDVYEWEQDGVGDCTRASASFVGSSGGCLALISSGRSPADSEFRDADPSGRNVFFTTAASLLPQDPGQIDLYDARVQGGFPPPPAVAEACEGEACQNPAAPPLDVTPGSSTFSGIGDLVTQLGVQVKPKSKPQTRAQRLASALRACPRKPKAKRAKCRARARKRYRVAKAGTTTNKRGIAR